MKISTIITLASLISGLSYANPGAPLSFDRACESGQSINLGVSGDLLFHQALQVQAQRAGNFSHTWSMIAPAMEAADIMYVNLESTTAPYVCQGTNYVSTNNCPVTQRALNFGGAYTILEKQGFTNTMQINVNPEILDDLNDVVDVLSTANNHTLDRNTTGIDITIDELNSRGYANKFTGTVRSDDSNPKFHAEVESNGIRVAYLACTFHTNIVQASAIGYVDRSKSDQLDYRNRDQIMYCYQNHATGTPNQKFLNEINKLAREYDAVIATPHWGDVEGGNINGIPAITQKEINLTNEIFKAGALAVFGTHPHVIQKWEKKENLTDSLGKTKDRFVIYSTGNFIANQGSGGAGERSVKQRTGLILHLGITKNRRGETFINGVKYFPYYITPSSLGPTVGSWTMRAAVGFNHPHVDSLNSSKRARLKAEIDTAKAYVNKVLPIENRVLNANGNFDTKFKLENGIVEYCN